MIAISTYIQQLLDRPTTPPITPDQFGPHHWMTLIAVEEHCVHHAGDLDARWPRSALRLNQPGETNGYGSILADDSNLDNHDDWDNFRDMQAAGWMTLSTSKNGTRILMTMQGMHIAHRLRVYLVMRTVHNTWDAVKGFQLTVAI